MSRSETVWIVDDDRSIRWVLEKALQQEGMSTQSFDSADGVLARLTRQQPDVIISDIAIPDADGYQILKAIRASTVNADTPTIAYSGYGGKAETQRARAAGFDVHLTKPVDVQTLVATIRDLAKRKSAADD